ncbi:hypothetical protein ACKWTF_014792 [Chironomus riparius]
MTFKAEIFRLCGLNSHQLFHFMQQISNNTKINSTSCLISNSKKAHSTISSIQLVGPSQQQKIPKFIDKKSIKGSKNNIFFLFNCTMRRTHAHVQIVVLLPFIHLILTTC